MIGWDKAAMEGKVAVHAKVLEHEVAVLRKDIENVEEGQDPYFFEEVRASPIPPSWPAAAQPSDPLTGLLGGRLHGLAGVGGLVGSHRAAAPGE